MMLLSRGRPIRGQSLVDFCILLVIGLWWNIHGANAQIRCYFCMFAPTSTNISCLMLTGEPTGVPIVECPDFAVCTIRRYFANNQVTEFSRSCELETTSRVNQCFDVAGTSECQEFCKTDLCNTGDGIVGGSNSLEAAGRLVALLTVAGMLLVDWRK